MRAAWMAPGRAAKRARSNGLGVLVALAGCGRIAFDPRSLDGALAIDAPPCTTPFGAPAPATWLNTPARDWAPAESADGLTLYFSSNRSGNEELYRSVRSALGASWQAPALISELAMAGDEEENPSPAADELELYWGDTQIWRASRADRTLPFGPRSIVIANVAGLLVSPEGPHIARDQRTLYFTATTTAGSQDLFVIKRASPQVAFDEALDSAPIAELNSASIDAWPSLSADERVIVYSSSATGDLELVTASRPDPLSKFGNTRALGELNTTADDADGGISADGRTLWFASTRAGGMGDYDIYVATRDCP